MQQIQGFNYFITPEGDVVNKRGNKICKWVVNTGYYQVKLSRGGKSYFRYVHRLVAENLLPNPEQLPQVNHKDSDKLNNCLDNLGWVTNKSNTQHGYDEGCYKFKCRRYGVFATHKITGEIQEFESVRSLSEGLGLNRKTVSAILNGTKVSNNYEYVFSYNENNK